MPNEDLALVQVFQYDNYKYHMFIDNICFVVLILVNKTCSNRTHSCNCDFPDAKWNSDEGHYLTSKYGGLGITKMVFLQQENLQPDALGRITLGPLECVETS